MKSKILVSRHGYGATVSIIAACTIYVATAFADGYMEYCRGNTNGVDNSGTKQALHWALPMPEGRWRKLVQN